MRSCDRRAVADRSAISWGPIGNWLATVSWAYVYNNNKDLWLFGDQVDNRSTTENRAGIVCNHCDWSEISRQPVTDQSPTSLRPSKTFLRSIWSQKGFTCSKQNLLATKSSLRPSCNLSTTSRRPPCDPCNLPATARNNGREEVDDRLQAMCDQGSTAIYLESIVL